MTCHRFETRSQGAATRTFATLLCAAAALAASGSAHAQVFAERATAKVDYDAANLIPAKACGIAAEAAPTNGNALRAPSAEVIEITAAAVVATADAPAHCRVAGVIEPAIAFEVTLPDRWNGRFYMIGNGGHAGDALDNPGRVTQRNAALAIGFAFAHTNTGHYASEEPGASFALSNPQKAIDYAYRAVHMTAATAKAITADYYGRPVSFAYWNSCSNGGRQGLIEAQRYPEDFDGIIANAPWVDQTGFTVGAIWNQRALTETPVTAAKMALVADRVMATCDAVDGLTDRLIDDPRNCDFVPARDVPICAAGTDTDMCLTQPQADAVAKVYSGPTSNGKPYFPGFMPGSEAVTTGLFGGGSGSGWMNVIVPREPGTNAADFGLADNTMKYLVHVPPNPEWDFREFDFDRHIPMLEGWGALANAKDPDLAAFRARGGKILMTYGWADSILQPLMGVSYYERAVEVNGPDTPDFFRLFMAPGMAHCQGGIGPDRHDPVTAIVDWVEADEAPESIIASKVVDGAVTRSRPWCPYPEVARHSGSGSIDDAANFQCVNP
jgi:feruloyl esterase